VHIFCSGGGSFINRRLLLFMVAELGMLGQLVGGGDLWTWCGWVVF
jgi:hypothetical protein